MSTSCGLALFFPRSLDIAFPFTKRTGPRLPMAQLIIDKEKLRTKSKKGKAEEEEGVFGVLPNELLSEILVHHLQPTWQLVCKLICQQWRLLLSVACSASASQSASHASFLACGGHLKVLQWVRSQGCLWDEQTCTKAAEGGHLEVLQWARSQRCPWDKETCAMAAHGGHLEVLQWVQSQHCLWHEETCAMAAGGGHLKVLQWAQSQHCP